jgi:drug/metabolite transporter (DMT)-like permease
MGLFLLVSSAFLHALWNSWVKAEKNKEAFLTIVIVFATLYSWIGLWHAPLGMGPGALPRALVSGVFEGVYLILLAYTLRQASLAWAYAIMRGAAMVLVWTISVTLMGETLSWLSGVGAALIFLALWIPVFAAKTDRQSPRAIVSALACSVCIAGYHIFYEESLHRGIGPALLFSISLTLSLPFSLVNLHRRGGNRQMVELLRQRAVQVLIAGLVVYSSFMLFLGGLQVTAPGFAISLRNTSIFFALVLSAVMGEKVTRLQVATCTLIFLGALLMGWGSR